MIKLPEPVGRICKYVGPGNADAPKTIARTFTELPVGLYPDFWKDKESLYTEKQLKKAIADALEEAAEVCDNPDCLQNSTFDGAAIKIRQLKERL